MWRGNNLSGLNFLLLCIWSPHWLVPNLFYFFLLSMAGAKKLAAIGHWSKSAGNVVRLLPGTRSVFQRSGPLAFRMVARNFLPISFIFLVWLSRLSPGLEKNKQRGVCFTPDIMVLHKVIAESYPSGRVIIFPNIQSWKKFVTGTGFCEMQDETSSEILPVLSV